MAEQYVMRGNPETKRLQRYHMIMGLTRTCKLGRCRHCYAEGIRKEGTNGSMAVQTAKRALGEFASVAERESKETAIAHFKGGEPLDYPHLEELALSASELGLDVFITTNGLTVIERMGLLEKIQNACDGDLRVTLSLNGSKPEIDALLRVDLAYYHATVEAAKVLASAGITFDINYVVHEGNVKDLSNMVALTKELRASQLNILQLILVGRAAKGELRKAEPEQLLKMLFDVYDGGDASTRALMSGSLPDVLKEMKSGKCGRECVAGYRGLLYIKPDGKVFSCPSTADSRLLAGDIHSSSVEELMSSQALRRLGEMRLSPGCKGDMLSGGKEAESFRSAIKMELGESSDNVEKKGGKRPEELLRPVSKKTTGVCVQKNW